MKAIVYTIILITLSINSLTAQISPPGLGKTNLASWFAFGIRQDIAPKWQSMTYTGIGRKSTVETYNPFQKQSIWVLNQEFTHKFKESWQYSLALSYRRQDEYESKAPYNHADPSLKQEFRTYARITYNYTVKKFKIAPTLRQEFRKFYTDDFSNFAENFQLRSRFRLQFITTFDEKKKHTLTVSSEQLFTISKESISNDWSRFKYSESRFCIFYSFAPAKAPLIFTFGYMNNLVGTKKPYSGQYISFDLVWKNPFGSKEKQLK